MDPITSAAFTKLPWKWIILGITILLLLAGMYFGIQAYGASQYDKGKEDGVEETDAKWEAAAAELQEHSQEAAQDATTAAEAREHAREERSAEEKEQLDEALRNGTDPFDVLFGPSGV